MNTTRKLMIAMVLSVLPALGHADEKPLNLWYDKPAVRFEEALPLGNGHI